MMKKNKHRLPFCLDGESVPPKGLKFGGEKELCGDCPVRDECEPFQELLAQTKRLGWGDIEISFKHESLPFE